MTAAPAARGLRRVGHEARRLRVTPRFRGRELGLLVLVAVALYVGSVSLGATQRFRAQLLEGDSGPIDLTAPADAGLLAIYLGALFAVHAALVIIGRSTDQILLPTVGLLGGIGLLLMTRLPQNLAGTLGGLARTD